MRSLKTVKRFTSREQQPADNFSLRLTDFEANLCSTREVQLIWNELCNVSRLSKINIRDNHLVVSAATELETISEACVELETRKESETWILNAEI